MFQSTKIISDPENRSKKGEGCNIQASSMILKTNQLQADTIRDLYKLHLASASRIPLTVCPSWRLLEGLVRSHDENQDNSLTGDEKAQLVTTLATNPEAAVYRLVMGMKLNFPLLPFFGACGLATFIQGPLKPLDNYLGQPLPIRIELGESNEQSELIVVGSPRGLTLNLFCRFQLLMSSRWWRVLSMKIRIGYFSRPICHSIIL